jgi:SAM-dependent methyltransferase
VPQIAHDAVDRYVSTFERFREPAQRAYWSAARDRVVTTLNLLPKLPHPESVRVLEVGGNPYFMTVLIRKLLGYQVEVANEPTLERGEGRNTAVLVNDQGERHEVRYKTLNIEYDSWPWADDAFDIVLYCEVIEHLVYDPTHTLVEAHRVLKKGTGTLLLSTPNALCYTLLWRMLTGRNPFPGYSGHSLYARHHRLFSTDELAYLCRRIGYQVHDCRSVTDRAYDHPPRLAPLVRRIVRAGGMRRRLDVIYLLASAHGTARYADPDQELSVTLFAGPAARGPEVRGWVELRDEASRRSERHQFALPSETWQTLTLPVPAGLVGRLVVELGVDQPLVPKAVDPDSDDERVLGVAVGDLTLD